MTTQKTELHDRNAIDWLRSAAQLPGKSAVLIAITILGLSRRLDRDQYLMLTPRLLREQNIPRSSSYRALDQMEKVGLVEIQRQKGTHPLVTICWNPPTAHAGEEP